MTAMFSWNEQMLEKYFKQDNPSFDLLFPDKKTAKDYIKKYKKTILSKTDTIEGERIELTLQPQISFVLIEQSTGEVKAPFLLKIWSFG